MIGCFKKGIRIILIMMMLTGIAYAEGNFHKTALEPWIYQAMGVLKQKGFIANYPADWVNSGNQLSRFEIAYYIKGFILNQSAVQNLPDNEVEVLRKLIAEFQMELTDLGVLITDIDQVHPNLSKIGPDIGEYQDLDNIITKKKVIMNQPNYYLGQYFSKQCRKTFIFIPLEYVRSNYAFLLSGDESSFNVFYQPASKKPLLVVRGYLPINNMQAMPGYYLFPIQEKSNTTVVGNNNLNINDQILPLLDEVNQIQWVDSLWSVNGILPLNGYLPQETELKTMAFVGNLNQGLKVGDLLVYTENFNDQKNLMSTNLNFFLTANSIGETGSNTNLGIPIDLDAIVGANIQSMQLSVPFPMIAPPQTSFSGVDFSYLGGDFTIHNIEWPSNSKANAVINYHFNEYWTFLAFQSFDNSKLQVGWLTTTSLGIDYNDWVTLWLAYRLVDFDKPVVSGSLALHF